jgi:hypothetical protein
MEFELEGQTYKAEKINAINQFHILRRLMPVLGNVAPFLNNEGLNGFDALPPLADAIGKLSDSDSEYVIYGLLKSITRKEPSGMGWSQIHNGHDIMFLDIKTNMKIMMSLAINAFKFNMSGFFSELPSVLKDQAQNQTNPSNG